LYKDITVFVAVRIVSPVEGNLSPVDWPLLPVSCHYLLLFF